MSHDKAHLSPNHPAVRARRTRGRAATPALSPGARRWLGRTLQLERMFAGATPAQAAEAMGMHGQYGVHFVEQLEAGEVELSRARAEALQVRLGIPAPALLEQVAHRSPAAVTLAAAPEHRVRTRADARAEAVAMAGIILGALLLTAALVLLVAGHTAAGVTSGAFGWAIASFPIALGFGRVTANRDRRG